MALGVQSFSALESLPIWFLVVVVVVVMIVMKKS
jgi:hypothetical protein